MESYLEQSDGYIVFLESDLELFCNEASEFRSELLHAKSTNACNSFALQLVGFELDYAHAQFSYVSGELSSSQQLLAVAEQRCSWFTQVLASSKETCRQLVLELQK